MDGRIAVLGGDGIGPEVTAESVKVLDAIANRFGHELLLGISLGSKQKYILVHI